MSLYYLILWNQVDILQKHFKKDHVHMRLWTRFYGTTQCMGSGDYTVDEGISSDIDKLSFLGNWHRGLIGWLLCVCVCDCVCHLEMLPCMVQRTIQHNRWLSSVKLVGYREQEKSALWGTQKNRREHKGTHRSMYVYLCVRVEGRDFPTLPLIEEGALPLSWGHSWKKGIVGSLFDWIYYTDFGGKWISERGVVLTLSCTHWMRSLASRTREWRLTDSSRASLRTAALSRRPWYLDMDRTGAE